MMRLLKAFIASFMPGVIKPLHALWNELLAFLFLTLAAAVGFGPLRRGFKELDGDAVNLIKFLSAIFLTALMLGLGIYSFRRARKISRS
jgi:hypothetical protein